MNCGSTDPFPRRRVIKLILGLLVAVAAVVLGYYLYERMTYFRAAEERAKAVGDRVYETRPAAADPITGEAAPAGQ